MPHKRNPVKAEQLSGLARVLRGNLGAGLENVALWHERDISHSSVERVILPDSSLLAYYLLVRMRGIVEGMTVDAARMLENLDRSFGLVFSQPVLLALVEGGLARDEAYRIVQDDAMKAWEERRSFRSILEADDRVAVVADRLDEAFDLKRALRNADLVFDALDNL
jgi:adenylosuccinate lyase